MNAWRKATKISRNMIATPPAIDASAMGVPPTSPMLEKPLSVKPMITASSTCPAVMFANRRSASAKGLTKVPISSTGTMIGAR